MNKANINRQLNCAIYTRKSTDEGLDKEFNSLDAQRECAEAYSFNSPADQESGAPRSRVFRMPLRRT